MFLYTPVLGLHVSPQGSMGGVDSNMGPPALDVKGAKRSERIEPKRSLSHQAPHGWVRWLNGKKHMKLASVSEEIHGK